MRQAPIAVVAALLSGLGAAPAVAKPVPAPEAIQTISGACADSRAALLSGGGSMTAGTSRLVLTPGRFAASGGQADLVVDAAAGTYGSMADSGLRTKERKRALAYLKRPSAAWWVNSGRFETLDQGWAATFDQARDVALMIDGSCTDLLPGTDAVDLTGNTWTFTNAAQESVAVVLDDNGRLSQFDDIMIDYSAQSVALPTGAVPFGAWRKASQAASLNRSLRSVSREVARAVNADGRGLPGIDAAARRAVPIDRAVAMKVRQLRKGVLFYGRNPYTKSYHAWRVYLKGKQAVARRVAP